MPLIKDAEKLIRENLEQLSEGRRVRVVTVATLTEAQLAALNEAQNKRGFQPLQPEVLFVGRHLYNSRCVKDGYTIEDVIEQIAWALHESSVIYTATKMNTLISGRERNDAYGNTVFDKAVFECTAKHPFAELFSVVPVGDKIKPGSKSKGTTEAVPLITNGLVR